MALFSFIQENYLLFPILFLPLIYFIITLLKSSPPDEKVKPLPPGPNPWPLLGNVAEFSKFSAVALETIARKYGPLFLLRYGARSIVVGSSPAAATAILKTYDRALSARNVPEALPPHLFKSEKSSMIWAETCDNAWNFLRTVCKQSVFSGKFLDGQSGMREEKIRQLIEHLNCNNGGFVNYGELVFATVFNMFSNSVFSTDLMDLKEDIADGGIKAVMRTLTELVVAPNMSDFFPLLKSFDLQSLRKNTLKFVTKFRDCWDPIIVERRKSGDTNIQNDFLDVLLHNNFTNGQIHQLLTELFAAGIEGTAATITWAMAELIKNPESMKKVREELDQEFNKEFVNENSLTKLSYFQACIKETLRLHPAVALCIHRAPEECELMNYRIPKDSLVVVNLWAVGRDASTWDDPFKFKPDRFLDSEIDFLGSDFGFIPFGAGRRICPGFPMALKNVPFVLAALIHTFNWSLPDGEDPLMLDMNERYGLTSKKDKPLLLIPTPREF